MRKAKHTLVIAVLSFALVCSLLLNLSQCQSAQHLSDRPENPLLYPDSFVLSDLSPGQCDEMLYELIRIGSEEDREALLAAVTTFYKKRDVQTCQRVNRQYVLWQWLGTLPDNVEWCKSFVDTVHTDLYSTALGHEILARNGNRDSLLWLVHRGSLPEHAPVVEETVRFYVELDGLPDDTATLDLQTAEQLTFDAQLRKWRLP